MAIDAAVLRARIEVAGVDRAQQQLRSMDQSIKQSGQTARTAGSSFQQFDQRAQAIQGSARQAGTATTTLGTSMAGVGRSATQSATGLGRFSTGMKGIAAAAGGFAVAQVGMQAAGAAMGFVVDQASAAVDAASNLNESITKTNEVFDENASIIKAWANTSADAFGQSEQQALEAASTFGALFDAMGLSTEAATSMSMDLTELASDLASFNNSSPEEMLIKLRAGLVGELEPLRSVGVALNAATVEAKALELGLAGTTAEITEADKVQARYKLILEQTTTAQGDFARTSEGLANQQRILQANLADTRAEIGQALLPVVNDLTMAFNNVVSSDQFQGFLVQTTDGVGDLATAYRDLGAVIQAAHGPLSTWNAALEAATPININYGQTVKNIALAWAPAVNAWDLGTSALGFVADQVTDTTEKTEALTQAQIINTRATMEQDLALSNLHVAQGASAIHLEENIELFREIDRATMDTVESFEAYVEGQQAMTQEGHRGVQMAAELGVGINDLDRSLEDLDTSPVFDLTDAMGGLAGAYQSTLDVMDAFNSQASEFGSIQSVLEEGYEAIQEKQEAGIDLSEKEIEFLDGYEEALGRVVGGQQDATIESGIAAEAATALMIAQDELNQAIEDGVTDLTPYKDAVAQAEEKLGLMGSTTGQTQGAQGALIDTINGPLIGAIQTLTRNVEYIAKPWLVEIDAATAAAEAEILRIRQLASDPVVLPVSVHVTGPAAGSIAGGTPFQHGGGVTSTGVALVGEAGRELVILPEGAEVIANPQTEALMRMMAGGTPFLGGFQEGTGGGGAQQGQIPIGGNFTSVGVNIGEQISAGIQMGLDLGILETAAPTGGAIAAAMIEGAVKVIESDAEGVADQFVVDWERVPDLASQVGHDAALGLMQEWGDLQGELQLAILSGEDTTEIQAQLDAIAALITVWGGDVVGEVVSVGEAMEAALNMERFAGLFDMPGSAAPFDIAEIFGGDALDQVREEFHAIWDLQQIAQDLGFDEFAAELGQRMKELGLQEEMLEGIMGSDMGQKIADQLEAELEAAHIDEMWSDLFSGASFGLEEIVSGDALTDVRAEFQELFDLQRIAQEMGMDEMAAELGRQMKDLGIQEQMLQDMVGTDFGQRLAERMDAEEAAKEFAEAWNSGLDAAFSDNPVNFAEGVQDQISDIEGKIDLAPVLGIPADIVAGWQAELEGLQGEQDAFWASLAEGIASGLIDPAVLEELDEAGKAQLDAYLTPIVGEEGAQKIIDGIGAVTQITAEGLGQLRTIFEEDTEAAVGYIDDLIDAAVEGSVTWADAMSLMANVPRDDLLPVLEDLERQFRDDLVQAILASDAAAEQIAEQGLAKVAEAIADVNSELGDLMGFSDEFARRGSGGVGVITSAGGGGGGGSSGGGGGLPTFVSGMSSGPFSGMGGGDLEDPNAPGISNLERGRRERAAAFAKHAGAPPGARPLYEFETEVAPGIFYEFLQIGDSYLECLSKPS